MEAGNGLQENASGAARASAWPVVPIERQRKGGLVDQIVAAISAMVAARELRVVVESYDRLVTLGLLSSRRGSGYFVARQDLPATLLPSTIHAIPNAIDALTPDLYSGVSEALPVGAGVPP
eukprot:gene14021-13812_t